MGLRVDAVSSGQCAIDRLCGDEPYDLMLTDFAMPGKNGVETILSARESRPDLRTLLMTGYADDDAIAGIRDTIQVLRKPIDMGLLRRALA